MLKFHCLVHIVAKRMFMLPWGEEIDEVRLVAQGL